MRKLCPICNQELGENLWCGRCQRRAIVFVTDDEAAEDTLSYDLEEDVQRRELGKRLIGSLRRLQSCKEAERMYFGEEPVATGQAPRNPAPRNFAQQNPAPQNFAPREPVPQPYDIRPGNDLKITAQVVAILGVPLLLLITAGLLFQKPKTVKKEKTPAAETTSPVGISWPENDYKDPTRMRIKMKAIRDYFAQEQDSPEESEPEASESSSGSAASPPEGIVVYSDSWREVEKLPYASAETYGDTTFYYYHSIFVKESGLSCDYYHMNVQVADVEPIFYEYFRNYDLFSTVYGDERCNYYADGGDWYYTFFQQVMVFETSEFSCMIDYDTGSHAIHGISFSGPMVLGHVDLIREVLQAVSPFYGLDEEQLLEMLVNTRDFLAELDEADPMRDGFINYQDPTVGIGVINHHGECEVQIVPRRYADDLDEDGAINIMKYKE